MNHSEPHGEELRAKIERVLKDEIELHSYDARWPEFFRQEEARIRERVPADLLGRIEHFGSTAVEGLCAKPIVDILVEVHSLERTRREVSVRFENDGYDYFWRPTHGDDGPPFYAWFIRRNTRGERTHHIHMVEESFTEHWRRLLFRDYLRAHPKACREYAELKSRLALEHRCDRVAYTREKGEFIRRMTKLASEWSVDR